MILILLVGCLLYLSQSFDMPTKLTEHAFSLHQICLQSVPSALKNRESLEALVCGKNIHDLEVKQLLIDTSLIHIFVVSGSHFLLLRNFLARLVGKTIWVLVPLFIYAMITLCQPPSMRALAFLALGEIAQRRKLFLSNLQLVLLSGIFCVAFFPLWIQSRSLAMSLTAATAMSTADLLHNKNMSQPLRLFLGQSFMYVAMGFCLWGISSLHPLSILMNVLIGPLIGILLFPLGMIVILVPALSPFFDLAMNILIWILRQVDPLVRAGADASPFAIGLQWVFIVGLLAWAHHWSVTQRRSQYDL